MDARQVGRYRAEDARSTGLVVAVAGTHEWMPTRLDDTGRTMRALPIWMVKQAANLLLKDEARRIAVNFARLPKQLKKRGAPVHPRSRLVPSPR
jgi:hypothetical protein